VASTGTTHPEPTAATSQATMIYCDMCGGNSDWLGTNIPFHEIEETGTEENRAGLRVALFETEDHRRMQLHVVGDRMEGILADGTRLSGDKLINARIWLSQYKKPAEQYLRIDAVDSMAFWVPSFVHNEAPLYKFMAGFAGRPTADEITFCDRRIDPESVPIEASAFVVQGDRYDPETGEVITVPESDTWVNIECVGTAQFKLHLLRHTTAGSDVDHTTDWKARQAMLRMLRADYCATGTAFTELGHPLYYLEKNGWFQNPYWPRTPGAPIAGDAAVASIDAIWNSDGAFCISDPRKLRGLDRLGYEARTIRNDIFNECNLPGREARPYGPCSPEDVANWVDRGYAISLNPTSWPLPWPRP
jgi:hypothetical protein